MARPQLLAMALLACFALPDGATRAAAEQRTMQPVVPAKYAATAFGQSADVAGQTFGLAVYVQELTSDGEIAELASTLRHKGQDGLAIALDKLKDRGRVSPNDSTGIGMRVVRIRPTKDGGQHIVLATAIPGWQHFYQPPGYRISLVELDVDKDGKGTGSFAQLCTVKFNEKNEFEIERYGWKRYRLANVYRQE